MRSISGMPSDEMAGDAMRRVPLPLKSNLVKCQEENKKDFLEEG